MNIENLIGRTAQMISFGVSVEEIHEMLIEAGCDEGLAFLIYAAACIAVRD